MDEMVNLLVDLRGGQFDEAALARALREIESAGFSQRRERRDEQMRPERVTLSLPKAAKRLRNTERTENSHTV